MNPKKDIPQNHEEGIEVKLIDRNKLIDLSVNGQYKQLAGLGVIQLVSLSLEIDILREPISKIIDKYNKRKK